MTNNKHMNNKVLFINIDESIPEYVSDYLGWYVLDNKNKLYIGTQEGWKELTDSKIGDLTGLNTVNKTNIVGALNEIKNLIPSVNTKKETKMPVLYLYGELPTSKSNAKMKFRLQNDGKVYTGYCKIKCQGTSSMNYPKKNFTIVLYSDESLSILQPVDMGWSEQTKYCLKANYMDHTHARNVVNANLWADIVRSRSDYSSLPNAFRTAPNAGAIDGFPFKIYANGIYQGLYTWNIPKDKWCYGMTDDGISSNLQFVLGGEQNTVSVFNETSSNFRKTTTAAEILAESTWSIEVGNKTEESAELYASAINNLIVFLKNTADKDTFREGISQYIDVQSAIDYYLFQYANCGLDSLGKNQLVASYDGTKLMMISYDMDSTWGLNWDGKSFVSVDYKCPDQYEEPYNLLYNRLVEFYPNEMKSRYEELRNGALSDYNILSKFEDFYYSIGKDLYDEEITDTPYTSIPNTDTVNLTQLRSYIPKRLAYVDSMVSQFGVDKSCTSIEFDTTEHTFTSTDYDDFTIGVTVTPTDTTDNIIWISSNPNVAKVKNGVVKCIGTGTCQIKAVCGEQSVICTITCEVAPVQNNITISTDDIVSGQSWEKTVNSLNMNLGGSLEFVIDLTNCTNTNENILGVGNVINTWGSSGQDIRSVQCYYPDSSGMLQVNVIDHLLGVQRSSVSVDKGSITIKMDSTGIYVNGVILSSWSYVSGGKQYNFANIWSEICDESNVLIGSSEGNVRSLASYTQITAHTFGYSNIPCESVSLDNTGFTISKENISNELFLKSTITPDNTTDGMMWYSDNTSIVDVIDGYLRYVGNGNTNVHVSLGDKSASCNVVCNISSTENILVENHYANGKSWSNTVSNFDFSNDDYIECLFDADKCNTTLSNQNILSIGNSISTWGGINFHCYYTPSSRALELCLVTSSGSNTKTNVYVDGKVYVKLNKNGVFVNNKLIDASNYDNPTRVSSYLSSLTALTSFDVGSVQGDTRSTAYYDYIKYIKF